MNKCVNMERVVWMKDVASVWLVVDPRWWGPCSGCLNSVWKQPAPTAVLLWGTRWNKQSKIQSQHANKTGRRLPPLLSPDAEYCMAVTATPAWGCSFISISEEAIWKILKVPSLYPAATHGLPLLEEGFQHTQPQAWQEKKGEVYYFSVS